jgi:hypothetical protein
VQNAIQLSAVCDPAAKVAPRRVRAPTESLVLGQNLLMYTVQPHVVRRFGTCLLTCSNPGTTMRLVFVLTALVAVVGLH